MHLEGGFDDGVVDEGEDLVAVRPAEGHREGEKRAEIAIEHANSLQVRLTISTEVPVVLGQCHQGPNLITQVDIIKLPQATRDLTG